jgi:hypothetical protein
LPEQDNSLGNLKRDEFLHEIPETYVNEMVMPEPIETTTDYFIHGHTFSFN